MAVVGSIDELSNAISHATAPAFMLGAVAGFLSVLIGRMERVADRTRALRAAGDGEIDPPARETLSAAYLKRMSLLSRAIYFSVLSALVTAALLIGAFVMALIGVGHGGLVAVLFVVALALLMASLVELTREIRVHMKTMGLD